VSLIIYGRHPVLAALRQPDAPLEEVIIAQGVKGNWVNEVRQLARSLGLPLRVQQRAALDRLAGTAHHQGVLARRGSYRYYHLDDLLEHLASLTETPLLVAADGITDPMNLGNLSRSALAAGSHGLIIPKDRAVGVTPVVIKAGAGALEYLRVYRVTNLAESLMRLKEAGLWIIGTDAQAPQSLYDTDLTMPLVVVIGSEDKGLRPRVRQHCDTMVAIPLAAPEIGSLNAASAGAVFLFEIHRQRLQRKSGAKG
jgi:23S rRNA (guanosine2251-2'-O)-methyltransferase